MFIFNKASPKKNVISRFEEAKSPNLKLVKKQYINKHKESEMYTYYQIEDLSGKLLYTTDRNQEEVELIFEVAEEWAKANDYKIVQDGRNNYVIYKKSYLTKSINNRSRNITHGLVDTNGIVYERTEQEFNSYEQAELFLNNLLKGHDYEHSLD